MKKPRPLPAGPRKSLYATFSARETSQNHPLKVDSRIREVHTMVARSKLRMTRLLKGPVARPSRPARSTRGRSKYRPAGWPRYVGHFTIAERRGAGTRHAPDRNISAT